MSDGKESFEEALFTSGLTLEQIRGHVLRMVKELREERDKAREDGLLVVKQTQSMLGSALQVIASFRPLATAVRKNLKDCPADVRSAFEGIADMVADADAEAGGGT